MPLSQLRRITARGQGVTVALTGEAGMGKSERANRFLKTLPARVFHFSAQFPLARLAACLPPASREPEWVTTLFTRLARSETLPHADLAGAVTERLLARAPAVLQIDHFHRASVEALPFWKALAGRVRASRGIGLLLLTREEAPQGWEVEEVSPLSQKESDALVKEKLGDTYRPDLAAWLFERARGHPLFTLELLSQVGRTGEWGMASYEVPHSLRAFVHSQLPTQLDNPTALSLARTLLRADVQGGLPTHADEDIAVLERAGVIPRGQLKHPLYREVLLSLLRPELLTQALNDVMAKGELGDAALAATQSNHWPLTPEVRLRLFRQAAEELERRQELTRAAEFWEKASELCPEQRAAWLERASRLYEYYPLQKGLHERSWQALRAAVTAAGAQAPREWLTRLVRAQGQTGRPLAALSDLLPGSLDDWQTEYSYGTFIGADLLDAQAWQRWEALSPAEQRAAPAEVLSGIGSTEKAPPEYEDWLFSEASRRASDDLTRLQIRGEAAYKAFARMENERALQELEAVVAEVEALQESGRREAERTGWTLEARLAHDRAEQTIQYFNRGRSTLLFRLGNLAGFEALKPALMAYARERQALAMYIGAVYRYGWELANMGQFEQAQRLLLEAYSSRQVRGAVLMALIDLYALKNAEEQAHLLSGYLAEFCAGMRRYPQIQYFFVAAWGLTASGDWEAALPLLEEGEQLAREAGLEHPLDYGKWIRAVWHGEQGDIAEGERLAQEAADASRQRGLHREADRYALWAAHYSGDEARFTRAADAVRGNGDLGHLHAVQSRRHSFAQPARAHLQILGSPRLLDADGQPVRTEAGLRLLLLLLHARLLGEDGLGEAELTGQFYPDLPANVARRNLSRLVRNLTQKLGAGVVVRTGQGYALGDISSDAELFLNEGAADLWRGPLPLSADPRGDAVAARLLSRLQEHVTRLLTTEPAQAARLAAFLTESEPYDLPALRLRLHAHDLAGQSGQARTAYAAAKTTFAEVGEELPADWRTFLSQGEVPALVASVTTSARAASRARALQVHRSTIARWDAGKAMPGQVGRPPKLTPTQVAELRRVMEASPAAAGLDAPHWTLKLAAQYAEKVLGVSLSQSQLSRLLREG